MLRLGRIRSSLSTAMKRCKTRSEPKLPKPQPTVESKNVTVMPSPAASVNGFQNPAAVPSSPLNGSEVMNSNVTGKMMKPASMIESLKDVGAGDGEKAANEGVGSDSDECHQNAHNAFEAEHGVQ